MSKRLGGVIGHKDRTSSWHLIGFPDGSNIGSTVECRGETHRYTVHLVNINRHALQHTHTSVDSTYRINFLYRRYFQHAHFIPIVGVGKRGAYLLVHGDLARQHSFETTLRFTGPVPADSRQ